MNDPSVRRTAFRPLGTTTGQRIKRGVWIFLVILALIFVGQNATAVGMHYLVWKFSFSLSLVVIFAVIIGMVLGWILAAIVRHSRRNRRRARMHDYEKSD